MFFKVEIDDGTGNFIFIEVEAENQNLAEELALLQVNNMPTSDPDQSIVVSSVVIYN